MHLLPFNAWHMLSCLSLDSIFKATNYSNFLKLTFVRLLSSPLISFALCILSISPVKQRIKCLSSMTYLFTYPLETSAASIRSFMSLLLAKRISMRPTNQSVSVSVANIGIFCQQHPKDITLSPKNKIW